MRFASGVRSDVRKSSSMNGSLLRQYIRFCLVGGSGVLVDMGLLFLLVDQWSWNLTLAKVLAAEAALLNNFFWNDRWTFRGVESKRSRWQRLVRFQVVCLGGMVLGIGVLHGLVAGLAWNVYAANGVAIVVASVWNFGMNRRFNWAS